jgi:Flp pilus assembly protein CpaB
MKKQHRTLIVMLVAVVTAAVASFGMYRVVKQMPVREVEVANVQVVVAAMPLPMGTRLHQNHLRTVAWPSRNPVAGAFADPKELIDRGVIAPIGENEPITMSKIASLEAGAGLPPVIPEGMRAISVKVNEVVGVAGFVVPGTRVDVLVTVANVNNVEPMTRTVVSRVEVLTAGTKRPGEIERRRADPVLRRDAGRASGRRRAHRAGRERGQDHARAPQSAGRRGHGHERYPSGGADAWCRARADHRSSPQQGRGAPAGTNPAASAHLHGRGDSRRQAEF